MALAKFLDSLFGRFRRTTAGSPRKAIGSGGTAFVGGYIVRPEAEAALTGPTRWKTFGEILANVSIVAAGVRYYLNLGSQPSWTFEPAEETPQAQEIAEKCEAIVTDMTTPWHRVVRRALMYRFYGFSIQEWTAKLRKDGTIGLLDIEPRPQKTVERWDVDETGTVLGVTQINPNTGQEIYLPRGKLLYVTDDSLDDSPEGLGIFRHLVDPATRLKRLQKLEILGYETDLRGIPIARAPLEQMREAVENQDLGSEERDALLKPLKDITENHIVTETLALLLDSITYETIDDKKTPSSVKKWDFDLLKSASTGLSEVGGTIERITRELAWILGVEHLLLGSDSKGSHALARDKSHNFGLILASGLVDVKESIHADIVKTVGRLNGWPEEILPKPKVGQVQYRDIETITGALSDMANAGAVLEPDDPAIPVLRDLIGLPRPLEVRRVEDLEDASLRGKEKPKEPGGNEPAAEEIPDAEPDQADGSEET